jgi:hypothetical protein
MLGVAVDFPSFGWAVRDEVARFAESYMISFPLLLGEAEIFTRFVGAEFKGLPTTVIYDRNGAIVARDTGSVTSEMLERFITKRDRTESTE